VQRNHGALLVLASDEAHHPGKPTSGRVGRGSATIIYEVQITTFSRAAVRKHY